MAGAGAWAYRHAVRPDEGLLVRLAEEKLRSIFGPGVAHDAVRVDPLRGVIVEGLRVSTVETDRPTLVAGRVEIRHDLVALASGIYRAEAITIASARIVTRETEEGAALDFPFRLEPSDTTAGLPVIRLEDATVLYRAREDSHRLRPGWVLHLGRVDMEVTPTGRDWLRLDGRFQTRGLGQDDVSIVLAGSANVAKDTLRLRAAWDPLTLTPHLLQHLAPEVAAALERQAGRAGRLEVLVTRQPDEAEGRLRVAARWEGQVRIDLDALPGAERIEAGSLEQLRALFTEGALKVAVTPETVEVTELLTRMGTGSVRATGRIQDEGESVWLDLALSGLRLEDPAIRSALGPAGAEVYDTFSPTGVIDADVRVRKSRGHPPSFEVDAILEDASFRYFGTPSEDGTPSGFPYPVVQANGRVHVVGRTVWFEDVVGVGRNGRTTVTLRGAGGQAWTGGETGRIQITDRGPDVRLTIDARDVPVDHDMDEAIDQSEFADLRREFRLEGPIDRVEVDVISVPGRDTKAYADVRLTLSGERFSWARFPFLLEDVRGQLTYRRPFVAEDRRGKVFAFDVTGRADGAPLHLAAEVRVHEDTGMLRVEGTDLQLGGALTEAVLGSETTRDGLGMVWRWLRPRGTADVTVDVPIGEDPRPLRLLATLKGASFSLDAEGSPDPLTIVDVRGTIAAEGERVELHDLRGRLADEGEVRIEGFVDGGLDGTWDLSVSTDLLRLTPALRAALERATGGAPLLPPEAGIDPGSRLALDLRLRREPGPAAEVRTDVRARHVDGAIRLPGGLALALRGDEVTVRGDEIVLLNAEAEAPGILLQAPGEARLQGDHISGRFRVALRDLEPTPEVQGLLPEGLRAAIGDLFAGRRLASEGLLVDVDPSGGVRLEGSLQIHVAGGSAPDAGPRGGLGFGPLLLSPPGPDGVRTISGRVVFRGFSPGGDVPIEDLDGEAQVESLRLGEAPEGRGEVRIARARVLDVTIRDAVLPVRWADGILRVEGITGTLAGGRLAGRFLLHTRDPGAYEGVVRVDDFRLEALRDDLSPTGPPLSGRGRAWATFQSASGEVADLTGRGGVEVREGNLGDLPVLANVVAFVSQVLSARDPPRFDRADVAFSLHDEVVRFPRFDLAGPMFEMRGRGTLDLGGHVDLVFTPDFLKSFVLPGVMQVPLLGDALDAILREDLFYAIRLRGDLETAEPEVVPLPPLGLGWRDEFGGTGTPEILPRRVPRWFR